MTNYRAELQAFVDAAASFTEPALGHHKAWKEAVARARVALSVPESSANTACSITPPPELVSDWRLAPEYTDGLGKLTMVTVTVDRLQYIATQAARWGADQELEACCHLLRQQGFDVVDDLRATRRPKPTSLKKQALGALYAIATGADDTREFHQDIETIKAALEQLDD